MVFDTWQIDNHSIALTNDFRFGNSERVDSIANSLDRHVEALGTEFTYRFLCDCDATLQVETESWRVVGQYVPSRCADENQQEKRKRPGESFR